jgi:hypothetical protein
MHERKIITSMSDMEPIETSLPSREGDACGARLAPPPREVVAERVRPVGHRLSRLGSGQDTALTRDCFDLAEQHDVAMDGRVRRQTGTRT